ncbi:MAG: hypothetical protein A2X94_15760 [Bdellovibrionales bacterium GWB1_55_8]|nr:MAG: hypothetical protein A2X94_15760 [Bdellovibrionales bacterium GWB1_55_8]
MAVEDLQTRAAEMMKKVLTVGVGAIFLTEESLRGLVSEFKLPKELLSGILDSASKTKNEFLKTLSEDVLSRVSEKFNPAEVLQEVLSRNEIDLHIRINVRPKASPEEDQHPKDSSETT